MGTRESKDVVAVIAAAEVKPDGALIVERLERRLVGSTSRFETSREESSARLGS